MKILRKQKTVKLLTETADDARVDARTTPIKRLPRSFGMSSDDAGTVPSIGKRLYDELKSWSVSIPSNRTRQGEKSKKLRDEFINQLRLLESNSGIGTLMAVLDGQQNIGLTVYNMVRVGLSAKPVGKKVQMSIEQLLAAGIFGSKDISGVKLEELKTIVRELGSTGQVQNLQKEGKVKITKQYIQKLIKEEIRKVLRENEEDDGVARRMLDPGQHSPAIFSQGELDIEDTSPKRFPALTGLDEHFDGSKGRAVSDVIKNLWKYTNGHGEAPSRKDVNMINGYHIHGIIDEDENLGVSKITKVTYSKKKEIAILYLKHVFGKGNFGDTKIMISEGEIIYHADGYEDQLLVLPSVIVEPKLSKRVFQDLKNRINPKRKKSAKQTELGI